MNGVGWEGGGAMESSLVVNIAVNLGEKVALSGLCGTLGIGYLGSYPEKMMQFFLPTLRLPASTAD